MTLETEKLVDQFLKEIKNYLPDWLKSNEEKLEDILFEIRAHLWDSAQEIAGVDAPNPASMQEAITRYGIPKEIAKVYKTRGTPKYFISEELWPIYAKAILSLIPITFIVIAIVQVVIAGPTNLLQALINSIIISYPIIITFIMIVTGIFVGLSYEGYFPADLGSQATVEDETKESKFDYYKPDEFLIAGLINTLFGLFIITLPNHIINLVRIIFNLIFGLFGYSAMPTNFEFFSISVELQIWIVLMGITAIIAGITNLLKIKTRDVGFQLSMNILLIVVGIADIGLVLYIATNLHLFSEILPLPTNVLLIISVLGIILMIIDIIMTISKSIKLYELREEVKISSFG